jgi:hypothetical protein
LLRDLQRVIDLDPEVSDGALIDGRPQFVKRSLDDGEKVKIAAIDPDFV